LIQRDKQHQYATQSPRFGFSQGLAARSQFCDQCLQLLNQGSWLLWLIDYVTSAYMSDRLFEETSLVKGKVCDQSEFILLPAKPVNQPRW
jgi:hypothetical protein